MRDTKLLLRIPPSSSASGRKCVEQDEDIVFKEKGRKKGSDTEDFDQLRNEVGFRLEMQEI